MIAEFIFAGLVVGELLQASVHRAFVPSSRSCCSEQEMIFRKQARLLL